ncbi:MAG TPA: hypothetical protein VE687_08110 [Stellaceae bacterium]|nr:hypothetical protein [Stellaceae bacterium]
MLLRQKYLNILSEIVPAGLVGVSMLLGSLTPSAANEHPASVQPRAFNAVAERLAAIRGAVSALAGGGQGGTLSRWREPAGGEKLVAQLGRVPTLALGMGVAELAQLA